MKENWPRITVITPSYNQGDYIEATILSVLNQNYPSLEYIIIDGGSKDNTVDIIKKYEKQITYWISEPDSGQANAINKAFKIATGDIINWINSDDELAPNALATIGKTFINNPNCTLCIGRIEMFNNNEILSRSSSVISPLLEQNIGFGKVNQPSMYFSAKCHKQLLGLDERLHYMMDTEWYLRYLMVFGNDTIIDVDEIFSRFRYHDSSKTVAQAEKFRFERDSIYYSIAKQNGLNEHADFLLKYAKVNSDYIFKIPSNLTRFNIHKVLNYFIYQLGLEYYNYRVINKAKACFKFIDRKLLLPSEDKIFQSRMFRINWVPSSVWKLRSIFQ